MKVLYTAEAVATGDVRSGKVTTSDGLLPALRRTSRQTT
jgi:hypothetical protein